MGMCFAMFSLVCILAVIWLTRKHIRDSRQMTLSGNSFRALFNNMGEIVADPYPRYVFRVHRRS